MVPLQVNPFPLGTPGADTFCTRSLSFGGPATRRFVGASCDVRFAAVTEQSVAVPWAIVVGSHVLVRLTAAPALLNATGRTASFPFLRSTVICPK